MSSASVAAGPDLIKRAQELYDQHKYLDAYRLTKDWWSSATNTVELSVEALVLAGRLAARLGGGRLARWLLRKAIDRDPSSPRVRYFTRHLNRIRLLDELLAFNANSDLGGDDPELRGSWYATYAYTWATLRDYERADASLKQAHILWPNDSWIWTCEADVHRLADRWDDALRAAERARALDPRAPFANNSLGTSLLHSGRIEESAEVLFAAAKESQSYQLTVDACWHQCALAETLEGQQKQFALERAHLLAGRLADLTPLTDRDTRITIARTHLDIAELEDDYEAIERWSSELRSAFHRQLLANLKKNPTGNRIRLPFRRSIQKHEACVPTSIATVMSANGMDLSADEMAGELTFGGTHEWAAADWLSERGYHVRFFSVTPELAKTLLRHRFSFVLSWDADESGHDVAIVGLDERAELLLVHDPTSFRTTDYLVSILDRDPSPLGFKGMVISTQDRAEELDALLPADSTVMAAAQDYSRLIALNGSSVARELVTELEIRFPEHAGVRYLRSLQALEDGHVGEAFKLLKELLREYPQSPMVRSRFMSACRALGNTALVVQTLRDIVEAGKLPGLDSLQEWITPPERYVFEYADMLRESAENLGCAESLLHSVIRRQPTSAGAWHNLGDLLWQKRQVGEALLCYRLASCQAQSNEHYARAYADVLASEKREEEALGWLELRVRKFGGGTYAASTWVSWIDTLEDRGYPERAIAACNEALEEHSDAPELLSFAVPFFSRMGEWERADAVLTKLKEAHHPIAFLEASTHLHRMQGELAMAIECAESWIRDAPRVMAARYALLDLIAARDGSNATVVLSAAWMRENPRHEDFEEVYCAQLDRASSPRWKKYSILLRRLKRNPDDGWAWRELAFDCLYQYDLAGDKTRGRYAPKIARYLAECNRTSPENVATHRANALWLQHRGRWTAATAKYLESVKLDPDTFYSYRRVWECSSRLHHEDREELWNQLEPLLLNCSGRLSLARDVMALLDERFGAASAEKFIQTWRNHRPNDPEVIEAAADLLIEHGHGRSDAARAVALLEPAVGRYPYHTGLRFSLANAYRRAGHDADSESVLTEIARRHPNNSAAKIQLAWIRQRAGDEQGADRILDSALESAPRDTSIWEARVQMLVENAHYQDACEVIDQGLARMPDDVHWRNLAITLFCQCGASQKAIATARAGVEVYPRGAFLWLLLGRTLNEMRRYAEIGEIEKCLRMSLSYNRGLFETADLQAIHLVDQRRFDEAIQLMREIEKRMPDPSPAFGRLAWIKRVQGEKKEAVNDMANVLASAPWYSWGWNLFIEWLEEDETWELARRQLKEIPAPLCTNTSFRLRRLLLLEKAGLESGQLNDEWNTLLSDFPEDVSLYVRRYDSLRDSKRWDDASAVIEAILKVDPYSPYILARQVELLTRGQNIETALNVAIGVCFAPVEESTWPAEKVWDVVSAAGFDAKLFDLFKVRMVHGDRPTPGSFARAARHLMRNETKRGTQPRIRIWFPRGGARELAGLGNLLAKASWSSGEYRATMYSVLCDYGYHRLVPKLHKKFGCVENSIDEWSQVGRAYVGIEMHSLGREFLANWRERPGVAMWMVANYLICLSCFHRGQLTERLRSSADALAGLPHDHCAKYLAHLECEAAALLNDPDSFLQVWNRYGKYFDGKLDTYEYFKSEDRHLLADIPLIAKYIEEKAPIRLRLRTWKLRWNRLFRSKSSSNSWDGLRLAPWMWWVLFVILLRLLRFL